MGAPRLVSSSSHSPDLKLDLPIRSKTPEQHTTLGQMDNLNPTVGLCTLLGAATQHRYPQAQAYAQHHTTPDLEHSTTLYQYRACVAS
jgi:hypothetical protein